MAYDYEGENIRKVRLYNVMTGSSKKTKPIKELEEVYAKAKAFNEILNIDLDQHEIIVHGQVEDIVNKYMEDK